MSFAMLQEVDRIKRSCILCGKCTAACPSFAHGGIDPMEIMAGGEEGLDQCIVCGTCSRVCHRSDPFSVVRYLKVIQDGIHVSDVFRETGFIRPMATDKGIEPEWTGDDVRVMVGCVVGSMAPFIEYAASKAMNVLGVGASRLPGEKCCLHPIQFMEMSEHERRAIKKEMCDTADGRGIVTLCAGCSEELEPVDPGVRHIITFLHEHIDDLPRFRNNVKVGMEPGCSAMHLSKEMGAVLERMNCTVVNHTRGCCGKNVPVSVPLMEEREAECAGADVIVVGCPMCFVKFDSQENGIPVVHLAELVAAAAGHPESLGFHRIPVTLRSLGNRYLSEPYHNGHERGIRTLPGDDTCAVGPQPRPDHGDPEGTENVLLHHPELHGHIPADALASHVRAPGGGTGQDHPHREMVRLRDR